MWKFVAKLTFFAVASITLLWTASLTYTFVADALPQLGPVVPALALIVFDGGMLAWLVVFLAHAEGAGQRGVAIVGTVLDLLGVGLMTISEIFLGGQTLVTAPEALGEWALWGIGGWTFANLALVVGFHLLDPKARREMALRDAQDSITEEAFQQLRNKTAEIASKVADELSDEMVVDTVRSLTSKLDGGSKPRKVLQTPAPKVYLNAEHDALPALAEPVSVTAKPKRGRNGRKVADPNG